MLLTVLITFLCFAGTTAKFYLIKKNVPWNQAKLHCDVPSVNDIGYSTHFLLQEHFTAWTASKVSDTTWAYFYGCLDLQVNNNSKVFQQLNNYFPSDPMTVLARNIFDCQGYCIMHGDYFIYYTKELCKCIYTIVGYPVYTQRLTCVQGCTDQHIYCSSRMGLPLFKLKRDIDTTLKQNTSYSHQCLALVNSTMTVKDCTMGKSDVNCKGNINYNAANSTWQVAINHCPRLPLRRMGNIDTWLGFFRKRSLEDELCTAVSKTRGKIRYQYMSCLDTLWILCTEELESITLKTNHTDLSSQISATVAVDSLDNGTSGSTDTNATTESTESKQDSTSSRTTLNVTVSETYYNQSCFNFLDWSDVNISFVVAVVVIAVLGMSLMTLARIICRMRKKLNAALFTDLTVNRVQHSYSAIHMLQHQQSTRSYMEVLPPINNPQNEQSVMIEDITLQNIDTDDYIKSDESTGTGHYQYVL